MLSEIWNVVRYRVRALLDRAALDRELDEELRFHLEREAERHERAGLSREDALRRAEAEFGHLDSIKEASRRARGTVPLGSAFQTLRGNPRTLGVACAVAATGLGLAYMTAAGAPALYPALNGLALLMGLALYGLLRPHAGEARGLPAGVTLAFGAVLLATTLFGVSVEGASRWIRIAGVSLQISLVLLPAMLVAFARQRDLLSTLGVILAAVALALQPDRAMAGVLASALAVLAVRRRDRWVGAALGIAATGFAVTLLRPDTLPAVPYVDKILYTAFDVHVMAGLAVVCGALLLALPALPGRKLGAENGDACAVFGIVWLGIVVAAAAGNYPTPLVGYGGSAVVGYVLSLAFLPGPVRSTAAVRSRARDEQPAEKGTVFDLRIGIV
ncbi:permease prefix domain 1-containing protein [Longimicrobium sp.]|uniref:permease prefix domain 1-containing protein n=1 Tax=Longimicrobium sp. TaxID=2029185 RepID=UPI002E31D6DF|nr:permease prefix domain 1-containing protein [Longimicrobium sp.]HEX6038241.1 permease prefix domain 1-containing protein [Longimicrobium sp.]